MSIKLPIPPKVEQLITTDQQGKPVVNQYVLREIRVFFEAIFKILSLTINSIAWGSIGFSGSKLTDIETRAHSNLQGVAELNTSSVSVEKDKHLSNAQGKAWQDHLGKVSDVHGVASPSVVVGTQSAQTLKNKKYGGDTHYTEFEADGTMKMNGDATVWKDVFFPMAPPKTTGAGNPTLISWNGNLRGYSFAVNDVHDFDPQEFPHDGKQGSTASFHIHWISRTNVGADRAVKWQIEFAQANVNAVFPAATTASIEAVIPSGTTELTHYMTTITTFTAPNIAAQMFVRLTRIAAAGTAPADDPVVIGVHYHYELDTVGSRTIGAK